MALASRHALCLLCVVALMAVDGVNGMLLSVNRGPVMGGYAATPDEVAWLNIAFVAAKLIAFLSMSPRVDRHGPAKVTLRAGLLLVVFTGALAIAPDLQTAIAIRAAQGVFGALVLIAAQTLVFRSHPIGRQPLLQAALALAVVVVPVIVAPALHGWATDAYDWRMLFVGASATAIVACAVFHVVRPVDSAGVAPQASDRMPLLLMAPAIVGAVYALQQGPRFDWFDAVHIRVVTVASIVALLAALYAWSRGAAAREFLRDIGRNPDFLFGLCASFFAGFALFGSGAAIPLFGSLVLSLAPEHVGQLALSSALAAIAGLALAGVALQFGRVPVAAPIPVGIALFMAGLWLLSQSSAQTGAPQMATGTWLRGVGIGLLFVALTMTTLGGVARERMAGCIALFSVGRQLGGLAGTAFVSTMLEWRAPAHATALGQYLQPGNADVDAAQAGLANLLMENGYAASDAATASAALMMRSLQQQSGARAFDEVFLSLSMFFLVAIPLLVGTKVLLSRRSSWLRGRS